MYSCYNIQYSLYSRSKIIPALHPTDTLSSGHTWCVSASTVFPSAETALTTSGARGIKSCISWECTPYTQVAKKSQPWSNYLTFRINLKYNGLGQSSTAINVSVLCHLCNTSTMNDCLLTAHLTQKIDGYHSTIQVLLTTKYWYFWDLKGHSKPNKNVAHLVELCMLTSVVLLEFVCDL